MIYQITAGSIRRFVRAANKAEALAIGRSSIGRECRVLGTMPDNATQSIGNAFIYDTWADTIEAVSRGLRAMQKRVQGHQVTGTFLNVRTLYKQRMATRLYKKAIAQAHAIV